MPLTPSGVVVGSYTALVEGWPCKGSFIYATQKRRAVLVRVKRAATSGKAALRAVVSILAVLTGFHVTVVLPGLNGLLCVHVGLDSIPDALGLRLGFLNQLLELAQLPYLHFQFVDAHAVYLLIFWWAWRRWALPAPSRG